MAARLPTVVCLLLLCASTSLASPARKLLDAPVSPTPLPFVAGPTRRLAPELVPLAESLVANETLLRSALQCAEATGIADIASGLSDVIVGALDAFQKYGFCSLTTSKDQLDRATYMLQYGVSIHMRAVLTYEYLCEGLTGLPEQCESVGVLMASAAQAAASKYASALFCTDAISDSATPVVTKVLPSTWTASAPVLSCKPRH